MKKMLISDNENKLLELKNSFNFFKLNRIRISLAFLISFIVVMLGHALLPVLPHLADVKNHSHIALKIGFPAAAAIYMIFTYVLLIISILLIIPFINNLKSSLFKLAIAVGLLWFVGYFEAVFIDDTYPDLLILALNDSIPAFLLVFFMAIFSKPIQDTINAKNIVPIEKSVFNVLPIVITAFSVIGVRFIGYYLFEMKSRINDMMIQTIAWTVVGGILIGVVYALYQKMDHGTLWLHKVIRFTFILFGINCIMYNLFIPLLLNESFIDFIVYRALFDTIAVFIGASIGELLKNKMHVE